MKFSKRFIFIGLSVVCFGSLTFLLLPKLSPPPQRQKNEPLQRRETHSHPHPHDTHDRDTQKTVAEDQNPEKKTPPQENDAVESPSKGIRNAFKPALELWETDPELATAKIHDIASELGDGDPKWTELYHLLGHSIVERPPGAPDGAFLTLEDAKRYYLLKNELMGLSEDDETFVKELQMRLRWNKEGKQVGQQTQPIRDLLDWMQENAPTEWDTVNTHFWKTLPARNAPPTALFEENWRTIDERVDIQYDTFFESLELLPENALTLQTLFEGSRDVARETLSSEQTVIGTKPALIDTPQMPTHTWDMVHEVPVQVDDISQKNLETSPKIPENLTSNTDPHIDFQMPDFDPEVLTKEKLETALETQLSPERFNRALSTLTQYGTEEGIRRLKNDDPELASHIEKQLQRQNSPQRK